MTKEKGPNVMNQAKKWLRKVMLSRAGRFKTNELKARYKELRANALSETRICNYFENYAWDISSPILVEEAKRWPSVRGSSVNGIDQICRWVRQRLEVCDAWVDALPAQETPVEPEKPVEIVNGYRNVLIHRNSRDVAVNHLVHRLNE